MALDVVVLTLLGLVLEPSPAMVKVKVMGPGADLVPGPLQDETWGRWQSESHADAKVDAQVYAPAHSGLEESGSWARGLTSSG